MPLYDFHCQKCQKRFETLVTSAAAVDEVTCPACGSSDVKKSISAASYRVGSSGSAIPAGALSGCSSRSGFS